MSPPEVCPPHVLTSDSEDGFNKKDPYDRFSGSYGSFVFILCLSGIPGEYRIELTAVLRHLH